MALKLVHSKPESRLSRPTTRAAAIFGATAIALFALAAFGNIPLGSTPVLFGVVSDAGTTALLDSGLQNSIYFPNPVGTDAITCTTQDAGANAALGTVTLLGSNDGKNFVVLSGPQALVAPAGTVAWDPITSGIAYYEIQLDAGGTVAGSISCLINNKGMQP